MLDERDKVEPDRSHGSRGAESLVCPRCGHELSMYVEPAPDRAEALAARVAGIVGSWRFVGALLLSIIVWLVVNAVWQPFEPYPLMMIAGLAAGLATVAALQGPLILLAQGRAARRDRARDREAFRVAVGTEGDLHRLQRRLDEIAERLQSESG